MSTSVVFNGATYTVPSEGDENWGSTLSTYFIALATGSLQKTGGTFTLTAEADFGATYGLKSLYFKSRATNPASTGIVRLGNDESLMWRNAANNADLALKVNSSNQIEYAGNQLLDVAGNGLTGLITNAMVKSDAAIDYSKLAALTADKVLISSGAGAVSVSAVAAATLAYLDATSSVQTQLNAKAAASDLTSHTGNTSNPHSVTAAQVGNDTAQWNALKIKGVTVDDTDKGNSKILVYNSTSGNFEYEDNAATSIAIGTTITSSNAYSGLEVSNAGTLTQRYQNEILDLDGLQNLKITTALDSNAAIITITGQYAALSASNPARVMFRSPTITSGAKYAYQLTSDLSLTIPAGATLGHTDGVAYYIYVYLIENSGIIKLGVSSNLYSDLGVKTATAIGTGSDSISPIYSDSGYSNRPMRLIGRITSTQATAGTWATEFSEINMNVTGIRSYRRLVENYNGNYVNWPVNANEFADLTSVTLPLGEWELTGWFDVANRAVSAGPWEVVLLISTYSGTAQPADSALGYNWRTAYLSSTQYQRVSMNLPAMRVVLYSETTYYLKARLNSTTTDVRLEGFRLQARMINPI